MLLKVCDLADRGSGLPASVANGHRKQYKAGAPAPGAPHGKPDFDDSDDVHDAAATADILSAGKRGGGGRAWVGYRVLGWE